MPIGWQPRLIRYLHQFQGGLGDAFGMASVMRFLDGNLVVLY